MYKELVTYTSLDQARASLAGLSSEFALIHNAPHVFPPFETVPLGPLCKQMDAGIRAIFFDMDGTTTLTEDLCLLALEEMVREITQRPAKAQWAGLDHAVDYPNIIGSSSSKNIEYLLSVYGRDVDDTAFRAAFVRAAALTLAEAPDAERLAEVRGDLAALGVSALEHAEEIGALPSYSKGRVHGLKPDLPRLVEEFAPQLALGPLSNKIRAGMCIYYERLHGMFLRIELGRGHEVAQELYGAGAQHAIRPLPGIGVALALAKGWLGSEAARLAPVLEASTGPVTGGAAQLEVLGAYFSSSPAQVALVTSSGDYEANIVLTEVFAGLREEAAAWPVSKAIRERVVAGFATHHAYYDAIITASHSHEIRLKPYRDLYSIALQDLAIPCEEAHRVLGFEDTEAGIVAQCAAGLGVCCATPFEGSRGHNFTAASHVLLGGVPEAILRHGLFLTR